MLEFDLARFNRVMLTISSQSPLSAIRRHGVERSRGTT